MATARCYTKSGSVEKYESECFSGDTNHYPNNFSSNMTGPDSNGNYSITYNGYDDGDSSNYDCYCETIYGDWRNGGGVRKTFYFKEKITTITIKIKIHIRPTGENSGGNIVFKCTISSNDDNIMNDILKNNSIILSYSVVDTNDIVGIYRTRVTYGMTLLNPGIKYVFGKMYFVRGGASTNPSSGTLIYASNKYNWNISVFVGT